MMIECWEMHFGRKDHGQQQDLKGATNDKGDSKMNVKSARDVCSDAEDVGVQTRRVEVACPNWELALFC